MREAADVKVVVTSRILLRAYGEQEFAVPPLGLPQAEGGISAAAAAESEAVRLFVERAMATSPTFRLTDENAGLVVDAVRRLDGLPLAIELAAARLRVLPLESLVARLDQRLAVVTGGSRDRPERQQTLRGAIDWSHDLLDEPDRRLFARFAVFAGGACLSQAEEVCGPTADLGRDVLDGLTSLAEGSLVRSLPEAATEPRFAMLATIREYALERAAASGEVDELRRRHALAYLALAEGCREGLTGPSGRRSLDRLALDHDNLRAAFDWAAETAETETCLRLGTALWRFWQARSHLDEGRDRMQRALALPGVEALDPRIVAAAYAAAGGIAYWRADAPRIRDYYDAELAWARRTDDPRLIAAALYDEGFAYSRVERGAQISYAGGRPFWEEALTLYQQLDDERGLANAAWALSMSDMELRDIAAARSHIEESLRRNVALGDSFGAGWAYHIVGLIDVQEHRLDEAAGHFRSALEIFAAAGDQAALVILFLNISLLSEQRGDFAAHWRLAAASKKLRTASGAGLGDTTIEFLGWKQPEPPPGDAEAAAEWAAGEALTVDEAVAYAMETVGAAPGR